MRDRESVQNVGVVSNAVNTPPLQLASLVAVWNLEDTAKHVTPREPVATILGGDPDARAELKLKYDNHMKNNKHKSMRRKSTMGQSVENGGELWSVAVSPCQNFILMGDGDDGAIRVHHLNVIDSKVDQSRLVKHRRGDDNIKDALNLSRRLTSINKSFRHAVRGFDGTEKGRRTKRGKSLFLGPNGHSEEVDVLLFSHDKKKLFSGSRDYTIKIWNVDYDPTKLVSMRNIGRRSLVCHTHPHNRMTDH